MYVPIKPGDIVVATGGAVSGLYDHSPNGRWQAKLYPRRSDWGTPTRYSDGQVGLVVCRCKPTGAGREWMLVLVDNTMGWMCEGDGWERVQRDA